jgi:hypothetical protein
MISFILLYAQRTVNASLSRRREAKWSDEIACTRAKNRVSFRYRDLLVETAAEREERKCVCLTASQFPTRKRRDTNFRGSERGFSLICVSARAHTGLFEACWL